MNRSDRARGTEPSPERDECLARGLVAGYLCGHAAAPELDRSTIEALLTALTEVIGGRVLPDALSRSCRVASERLPGILQKLSVVAAESEALLAEVRIAATRAHEDLEPDVARGFGDLALALAEFGAEQAGAALRSRTDTPAASARDALASIRAVIRDVRSIAPSSLVADLDDEITRSEVTWYRSALEAEDAGRRVVVVPLIVRTTEELERALSYELDAYVSDPSKHHGTIVFAIDGATLPEDEEVRSRAERVVGVFLEAIRDAGMEHPSGADYRISVVWQAPE